MVFMVAEPDGQVAVCCPKPALDHAKARGKQQQIGFLFSMTEIGGCSLLVAAEWVHGCWVLVCGSHGDSWVRSTSGAAWSLGSSSI